MAKKNRKKQAQDEPRELTRKQQHINARDRERNRRVVLAVSITLGLVGAVLLIGILSEFVFKPNSSIATVGGEKISTRAFQERVKYEQSQLENQYIQLNQLEQQFGGQGFFTSQISQIEATLSSPFSLGMQTLDRMINETVIRQQAAGTGH
ncbi:MAG: SurA N-terminal domain-containing protein [Caldilineaceae bacterium]